MSLTIYGIKELILFSKYHNLQIHGFTDKVVIICQQHYPDMDASFTNGYPIIQTMVSAKVIFKYQLCVHYGI